MYPEGMLQLVTFAATTMTSFHFRIGPAIHDGGNARPAPVRPVRPSVRPASVPVDDCIADSGVKTGSIRGDREGGGEEPVSA